MKTLLLTLTFLSITPTSLWAQIPILSSESGYNILEITKDLLTEKQFSTIFVIYTNIDGQTEATQLKNVDNLVLDFSGLRIKNSDLNDICLQGLDNVKKLILRRNYFTSLPDIFCDLTQLTELDLSVNPLLTKLSESLYKLSNLESLNLCLCLKLDKLPDEIAKLSQLKEINLELTALLSDPDKLAVLKKLSLKKIYLYYWLEYSNEDIANLKQTLMPDDVNQDEHIINNDILLFSESPTLQVYRKSWFRNILMTLNSFVHKMKVEDKVDSQNKAQDREKAQIELLNALKNSWQTLKNCFCANQPPSPKITVIKIGNRTLIKKSINE